MNTTYLLTGGNMGDRVKNIERAAGLVQQQIGMITKYSSVYETASWGNIEQPAFLNQVLLIETNLSAQQTMREILSIENKLGRVRTQKNASRIIDIDILFFNNDIIRTTDLTIPHPQIENRNFVLYPLDEICPDLRHPVLKKNIHKLLLECRDTLDVKLYNIKPG